MRRFEGRVAVVTGAASGLGRATAQVLARRGCDLALADVNAPGLEETAASVRALGRRASLHEVDVADADRMAAFVDAVLREHGRIHLLVNNAGVSVSGTLAEQTLDDLRWIVGVNFWGVVYGCKLFLPHLLAQDEAHIVNVSSAFGLIGLPTQSSYCATKFAVRGFSEALWAELRATRVGVTVVYPGGVRTDIVRASRSYDAEAKQRMVERFERMTAPPERVAERIVRAVERGRMRQLVCRETYAIDALKRLFPVSIHRLVAAGYRRFGSLG